MVALLIIVLGEFRVEGGLLFFFCAGEGGVWELKGKYHIPILSASSAILERREGMLSWRCWILGLPGLLSIIVQMEVRIFHMKVHLFPFSYPLAHFQDDLSWFGDHLLNKFFLSFLWCLV